MASKAVDKGGKVWNEESIKELLRTSDKAVYRALVLIFENQTADEQNTESTHYHNRVGFRPQDAFILSEYANWYQKRGSLTPKQLEWARKLIAKYWRQLLPAIERKAAA